MALGAATAVLATVLTPAPAGATASTARPEGPTAASAAGAPKTVTLITGDKVTVTPGSGDGRDTLSVERRAGATGSVRIVTEGRDTYVYPDDALAYVTADRLDKRLFNVTGLLAQGYDDAHAPRLPLILTSGNPAALRRTGTALPGVGTRRELPSVGGQAVTADRTAAADAWTTLTDGDSSGRRTAGSRETGAAPSFAGGIDKIWLDGKTKATLADTTAQIGAPEVWESGGTGSGVKVAVLDTGADTGHPDLKDRIVGTRSFVPDQDVPDGSGHGTHVASTVAGTGAASDGKERGVAPGADLLVGKVLGNRGEGQESWVIGGMEWAARTEHAKVVNMSLGNAEPSDGNDLMSQSLNALSAETGTLFVVAAGNSGRGATPYTIGSPAAADAALTVGAVGSSDELANFSSVGPRIGDEAIKPDVTAPGVDVLAARSQYAGGGEGYYTTMSGTSMASPHVAGAAVLLAQRHPDWSAARLKDALMSTSKPTPYLTAYQGGSGRVDAAAAVRAEVTATGSVFRFLRWPNGSADPVRQKITYTNSGDEPVALRLAVEPGTSGDDAFALSADQVTVPAHGSAGVEVGTDPAGLARGNHTARIVARDDTGATVAHTVAGVGVEPERYDLGITMKDRTGKPMSGWIHLKGTLSRSTTAYEIPESGELTLRLPADTYAVVSYADVQGTHGPSSRGIALLGDPEVELTADRRIALDASKAHQVRAVTPKPSTLVNTRLDYFRSFTSTDPSPGDYNALRENVIVGRGYDSIWAQPTGAKVRQGSFVFATRLRAQETPLDLSYDGKRIDDALAQDGSAALPDGTSTHDAVFAGDGSPEELAKARVRGRVAVVRHNAEVPPSAQASAAKAAGARLLLVVNDQVGRLSTWYGEPDYSGTADVPVVSVNRDEGEAIIERIASAHQHRIRLRVEAHPSPAYLYDLVKYHNGAIPEDVAYRADPDRLARVDLTFAQPQGKQALERRTDFPPYEWATGYSFGLEPMAAGRRTDWVSAGDDVTWQQTTSVSGWVGAVNSPASYRPGSVQQERWLGPVLRPRMSDTDSQLRDETSLSLYVPGWSDSGAAHSGAAQSETMTTRSSLLQGGTTLITTDSPYVNAFDLPEESLPYRLVVDTAGDPGLSPYSSKTRTEWDFVSGKAQSGTVPLVQLDYGTELDAAGRARRTSEVSITPSVLGTDAKGAVSSVRLEVSYDDGATWHRQDLKERQGVWRTSLHAPSSAAFVSLRAVATARTGGSVSQTVVRAFGLK
ncbi:S8 family serine peptidase [Streptomyces sp. NPDC026673]|uniref:S8 family serine peptidase n=1 Tax=Streptomyces sp. NPDC026673 TaxID=3155724 RepID=UPI0033D8BEFE